MDVRFKQEIAYPHGESSLVGLEADIEMDGGRLGCPVEELAGVWLGFRSDVRASTQPSSVPTHDSLFALSP